MGTYGKDIAEMKVAAAAIKNNIENGSKGVYSNGIEFGTNRISFVEKVFWFAVGAAVVSGLGSIERVISMFS